jgi:hypothetical protein
MTTNAGAMECSGLPTFFETAESFAAWLEKHGAAESELIVGYYKRGAQRGTMSWAESVDAALCFGWIDGVRKRSRSSARGENAGGWPQSLFAQARRQIENLIPTSSNKPPRWSVVMSCGLRNPKPPGSSSKRSRPAIGSW